MIFLTGQTVVLDSSGVLSSAQGVVKKTGPFMVENDYGSIHLAVACKFHGEYSPFFVTPKPVMSGVIKLTPSETIIIWFAMELKVSSMFMEASSQTFEVGKISPDITSQCWLIIKIFRSNTMGLTRRRSSAITLPLEVPLEMDNGLLALFLLTLPRLFNTLWWLAPCSLSAWQ